MNHGYRKALRAKREATTHVALVELYELVCLVLEGMGTCEDALDDDLHCDYGSCDYCNMAKKQHEIQILMGDTP